MKQNGVISKKNIGLENVQNTTKSLAKVTRILQRGKSNLLFK